MNDSSDLLTDEASRSISIELYSGSTNQDVVQLALDAVQNYFQTHKITDLNNAIGQVEQLALSDNRNIAALNGLRHLREVLTKDSVDVTRDGLAAARNDGEDDLELGKIRWIASEDEQDTAITVVELCSSYEATRDLELLQRAIKLAESLALSWKDNEKALEHLVKLRQMRNLELQSEQQVEGSYVPTEISADNETPEGGPNKDHVLKPESMTNLENARFLEIFYHRFIDIGDTAYLENAVPLVEALITSTLWKQMDPYYVQILLQMVDYIASRLGVYELLGKVVDWVEAAVNEIPARHPDRAALLDILGYRLSQKYEIFGEERDLEQAIERGEESVEATPLDDPGRAGRLSNLGSHLYMRYDRSGFVKDLERAIEYAREAVATIPLGHANRSALLNNLGSHLSTRFILSGSVKDLEQALKCAEEALETATPEDLDRPTLLSNLSDRLFDRYEMSGEVGGLEQAIKVVEEGLAVTPADQAVLLGSLSKRLWSRYKISGVVEDLEQAIKYAEETLVVTPPGSTAFVTRSSSLGAFLFARYERYGAVGDLEHAIKRTEEALEAAPPNHIFRATSLSNLGIFLSERYDRLGTAEDLKKSIRRAEQAVEATPPNHTDLAARLNNLGTSLSARHKVSGSMEDLEQAIKWTEESVAVSAISGYIDRAALLHNLGNRLFTRYEISGIEDDLEQAIRRAEEAAAAAPPDHTDQATVLLGLASHLSARYEQMGSLQDFNYILRTLYSAWHCYTSPPIHRIKAAYRASSLLASRKMWQESSSILADAIKLLPKVTSRSIGRGDQENQLSAPELALLASDAVSTALQAGEDASACLRLFEYGRGIIMGLIIDCRNDESELQKKHLETFKIFHELRVEIDSPLVRTDPGSDYDDVIYTQVRDRRKLVADELDQTLASIRELAGFEGFQLPPHADSLLAMAGEGPIVVFNTTTLRSDAIILTCSAVKSLRLSDLVFEEADAWMREIRNLVRGKRSTYEHRNRRMDEMLQWLWDVAVRPVCEELQFYPVPETHLPHIWWIGAGPLANAPFHAAGDHRPQSTNNMMSRAISSYIPTIKALSYAREKKLKIQDSRILLVTMPTTPGKSSHGLPQAMHEAATIVRRVEGKARTRIRDRPSAAEVLTELPSYDIIHFACHGVSDPKHPSNSALLLQPEHQSDEPDRLTVEMISNTSIQPAQIAYLSACSTAENPSRDLADESIYIASGFQLAGFSHVLATRWISRDDACQQVAEDFYRVLFDGEGDHRKVRVSFHIAVKKLRDAKLDQPILWASFIHTGA